MALLSLLAVLVVAPGLWFIFDVLFCEDGQ
jgi:hypothetical protein